MSYIEDETTVPSSIICTGWSRGGHYQANITEGCTDLQVVMC